MNRVHHESLGASGPYHCRQRTAWFPVIPTGMRLSRRLTNLTGNQRAEKTIGATMTMIIEAEEWARRALAVQGFGDA